MTVLDKTTRVGAGHEGGRIGGDGGKLSDVNTRAVPRGQNELIG